MNWGLFASYGWAVTTILAFMVWGIQQTTKKAASDRISDREEEKDAVLKRIAEYDARVEHIVRNALLDFENRMFARINGTYVRSKEAELRFSALQESLKRIEMTLDAFDGNRYSQ